MAKYRIEISATAEKQLKKIAKKDQLKIVRAILELSDAPYPPGVRKLTGYHDVFRLRIGTYRVIYSVEEKRILITVLKVGHRKDIYRR